MSNYIYELQMKVRDYECDLQGVVNNANYLHYMEHARHEFLETLDCNFGKLHNSGIDAMVAKAEVKYMVSLISGDNFKVCINIKKTGAKMIFNQDIYRTCDGKLCAKGKIEAICLVNGKLSRGEFFDQIFAQYL